MLIVDVCVLIVTAIAAGQLFGLCFWEEARRSRTCWFWTWLTTCQAVILCLEHWSR